MEKPQLKKSVFLEKLVKLKGIQQSIKSWKPRLDFNLQKSWAKIWNNSETIVTVCAIVHSDPPPPHTSI